MKKTVISLMLLAVALFAAGCFFEPAIPDAQTLDWNAVAGTSWAQQPYDGDTFERVTFYGDGTVTVSVGELETGEVRYHGNWQLASDLKRIEIDGLRIFDAMSGRRYQIVEGYIAAGDAGRGLRLAYDAGSGPEYGALFNYAEVTETVQVVPWEPVITPLL